MKICYLADVYSPNLQGWFKYFADQGHDVHIISEVSEIPPELARRKNITIHPLNRVSSTPWQQGVRYDSASAKRGLLKKIWHSAYLLLPTPLKVILTQYALYSFRARRYVRRIRPDLVHGCFLFYHAFIASLTGFKPLLIYPRGTDVITDQPTVMPLWFHNLQKRFCLWRASHSTAVSRFLAQEAAKYAPGGKGFSIIPEGVDCVLFSPKNRRQAGAQVTLGFVKHLKPKYGPEYLLRALQIVIAKHPQTRLIMAGEGEMEAELKEMAADLGLQGRVTFVGRVAHIKVPDLLAKVDIFVMPSVCHSETLGLAALEASAMEIPVVATRVGGVPEAVVDGLTGILVEPGDEKALAQAISELVEKPLLRDKMGKKGREYVLSRFQWQDCGARMAELYRRLIEEKGKG